MGDLDESLGGLGGISGLLADDSDAALGVGNDANGLSNGPLVSLLILAPGHTSWFFSFCSFLRTDCRIVPWR